MSRDLPIPIRPGQTFVQAVQANFDHFMGELANIAEALNDLVKDQNVIKELLAGTIDESEELAGEFHDTLTGTIEEVVAGTPGLTGAAGASGIPGRDGEEGEQGIQGPKGDPGPKGADGAAGSGDDTYSFFLGG